LVLAAVQPGTFAITKASQAEWFGLSMHTKTVVEFTKTTDHVGHHDAKAVERNHHYGYLNANVSD
jgi:hypothetical protein